MNSEKSFLTLKPANGGLALVRIVKNILVNLITLTFIACNNPDTETEIPESTNNIEQSLSDISAQHNAINLHDKIDGVLNIQGRENGLRSKVYTVQLQDALIDTLGRPGAILLQLSDIFRKGEKYITRWYTLYGLFPFAIYFELECDAGQAARLIEHRSVDWFDEYFRENIIVAKISDVRKLWFAIEGHAINEEDAEIDLNTDGAWIASGTLIAFYFPWEDK